MKQVKGDLQISRNLITGVKDVVEISSDLQLTIGLGSHVRIENTTATIHTVTLPTPLTSEISQHILISNLSSSSEKIYISEENTTDTVPLMLRPGLSISFIYSGTHWHRKGLVSVYPSVGAITKPTWVDNEDGSITVNDNGIYILNTNVDRSGSYIETQIDGGLFNELVNNTTNYIVVDYNSGSPIMRATTDMSGILESTIVPVLTIYRKDTYLGVLDWNSLGNGLANAIHHSIVKTQRFRRESGLMLSEKATRYVTLTEGIVFYGAVKTILSDVDSETDGIIFHSRVGTTWSNSIVNTYNNTQYNDSTGLQNLSPNRYAVNWIYRCTAHNHNDLHLVLGEDDYKLNEAVASQPPDELPTIISTHGILVGRIIVERGQDIATQIDSAFDIIFSPSSISSHANLTERDIAGNHAKLIPLVDGTTAIQITKADETTVIFNVDSLTTDPKVTVTGMLETITTDTTDSGDNIQNNGVIIDGDVDTDKQILFRDNGVDKWALQGAWRNESGEFFYLYNLTSDENLLAVSQNGRFSFNKPTNIIMEHAAFVGTGLNDLTPSGLYTERINRGFNIEIDSVGTPDTFKWSVGTLLDGFVEQATNVPITTGAITLGWGVDIEFGATTGHTLGDKWAFRVHPQDALDTMTVKPPMNDYVYSYNGTSFFDDTYQASTTHCSIGSTFTALNTTDYILYLGNCSKFNSSYFIFEEYGAGITLVVEYWNGSTWVALTSSEGLIDTTANFTANGSVSWDKSVFPNWTTTTINDITCHWIRFRSSNNATTIPTLKTISRHTGYRFAVYSAHNDTIRAFDIRGDGVTEMFEANRTSTATTYRTNEYITEARLRSVFSLLISNASYFTNDDLGTFKLMDETLPLTAFSVTVSVSTNDPTLIQKWVESDAYGKDMVGGERFEAYLFLQRSNASRGMTFYCELWQVDGSGVDILLLGTSNIITAPNNADIEAYDFNVSSLPATFGATDRLAIKVYALRTHPTTQTVALWGGDVYPSQLDYPSETVTLDQLLNYFEEDISGSKSQWKAKGTGTDIDIELVPKGNGIVRTTSNMTVDGSLQVSDNTDIASASNEGSFRYYKSGNNSYVDVCMQTGASTYAWVNIVQNNW